MSIKTFKPLVRLNLIWPFIIFSYCQISMAQQENALDIFDAVAMAQAQDPWLQANQFKEDSLRALSISVGVLPDPDVFVEMANLPANTGNFGQETMTQFKVGITQAIPSGDTLNLRRSQLNANGDQHSFQRDDRRAWVAMTVSKLWLDAHAAQQIIELIQTERGMFDQLAEVVEVNYASSHGNTRQQDLIRAQLELTSLEDRLTLLALDKRTAQSQLSEWIGATAYTATSRNLPDLMGSDPVLSSTNLLSALVEHPKIQAIDEQIQSNEFGVSLAEQRYRPSWSINANYGYRGDDPLGNTRADLFSIGVGFDLPFFTANRQDKLVESATADREATKTERILVLRELRSGYETAVERVNLLKQRIDIYDSRLLVQMSELRGSALNAYISNDGDFAEVVHAHHAELNSKIEQIYITVDLAKTHAQINYYLAGNHLPVRTLGVAQ